MKGTKKVETNYLTQIYRERAYRLHVQKLNDISDGRFMRNKYLADNHTDYNTLLLHNKLKAKQRNESAKLIDIQHKNNLILSRLMKISNRDPSLNLVPTKKPVSTSGDKTQNTHTSKMFRSSSVGSFYNFVGKTTVEAKMKAKQLAKENFQLAERMIFQQSEIAKWKLDRDYAKFKKIGDRLKRIEVKEGDGIHGKVFKKGDVEYRRDGRIQSKSRMLPPMPVPVYHKKLNSTWRSSSGNLNSFTSHTRNQKSSINTPGQDTTAMDMEYLHKLDEMVALQERDIQSVSSMRYTHRGFEYRGLGSERYSRAMSTDRGFYPRNNSERAKALFEMYQDNNVASPQETSGDDLNVFITTSNITNIRDRDDTANLTAVVDRNNNQRVETEEKFEKSHGSVRFSEVTQRQTETPHREDKMQKLKKEEKENSQPLKVHDKSASEIKSRQKTAENNEKEEKSTEKEEKPVEKEFSHQNDQIVQHEQNEQNEQQEQKQDHDQGQEQEEEQEDKHKQHQEEEHERKQEREQEEVQEHKHEHEQEQEQEDEHEHKQDQNKEQEQEQEYGYEQEQEQEQNEKDEQNAEASYHGENNQKEEKEEKAESDEEQNNSDHQKAEYNDHQENKEQPHQEDEFNEQEANISGGGSGYYDDDKDHQEDNQNEALNHEKFPNKVEVSNQEEHKMPEADEDQGDQPQADKKTLKKKLEESAQQDEYDEEFDEIDDS